MRSPAFGTLLPADSTDPAADARRAESLGLAHVLLTDASASRILIILGATREIRVYVDDSSASVGVDEFGPTYAGRLVRWPDDGEIVKLDLGDETSALRRLRYAGSSVVAVELESGPHHRLVRRLALDLLPHVSDTESPETDDSMRYAEDLTAGEIVDLGEYEVSLDDIIAFAERWDPLDFHTDVELATRFPLGVLCASGLHTQAIVARLLARGFTRRLAIVAGRGSLGMRLWQPVTPGMILRGSVEIEDIRLRGRGRADLRVCMRLAASDGSPVLEQRGEMVVLQRARSESEATVGDGKATTDGC